MKKFFNYLKFWGSWSVYRRFMTNEELKYQLGISQGCFCESVDFDYVNGTMIKNFITSKPVQEKPVRISYKECKKIWFETNADNTM